jgi:hypothetical protein
MKSAKKISLQIYLEPEQDELIRRLSKSKGVSRAAIVRTCVAKFWDTLPLEDDPAWGLAGLGAFGKSDISRNHDGYLVKLGKRTVKNSDSPAID